MESEIRIFGFILHLVVLTFLLSSVLLWMRRRDSDKARRYLSVIYFIGFLCFLERLAALHRGVLLTPDVLSVSYLCGGVLGITTLYFYPIEVISPGWINRKKLLLLFLPWLITVVLLAVLPFGFRSLASFGEMVRHIGEFNVWFRLLLLLLAVPSYSFLLFYIPYNWRQSSADNRWIRFYIFWGLAIALSYMVFILTGRTAAICLHHLLCLLFCIIITYKELYIRMAVPAETKKPAVPDMPGASQAAVELQIPKPAQASAIHHPLWNRLNRLMEQEELWRNPNLSLEELAMQLGTNRTTLAQLIRQEYNESYKEFINRYRIGEFLKLINTQEPVKVQDALFKVGFRSRATALRYFKYHTGTTPTEYLRKLKDE